MLNREPGLCLAGEVDTGAAAVDLFFRCSPDVVVVDAALPDRNGFKVVECLKRAAPSCHAILLCHSADPCVEEVSRMVGADHVCHTGGELNPVLAVLRKLVAASQTGSC
jgi:DNA-binding NarL/FixJ family response regulator